jgi:phosphate:Na+ symporter
MMNGFDIWLFLAGLGIFFFGLNSVERSLRNLAGRPFKKFLRRQTSNPLKGVLSGTIVTAILQSSSAVSLMVLAFVGAGIFSLKNALGIIFGSNLGTTFTGWIVASLGFKLDIESFAIPSIAVGGIMLFLFSKVEKPFEAGRFALGFGLLFLGLSWMKGSMEYLAGVVDLGKYQGYGSYWFFLVGLVLTMIIQSSSASMVITLSALYSNIITLEAGAAMVIGSDLGTTITVILGATKGSPDKKRVAAGHVLFNLITDVIALIMLFPLLRFLTEGIGLSDPMITLVAFHSAFNLIGIILLLPFIGKLSSYLEKKFAYDHDVSLFIDKVPSKVPDAAIEALNKEIQRFIRMVMLLNLDGLRISASLFFTNEEGHLFKSDTFSDRYDELKQLEGEIVNYYMKIQNEKIDDDDSLTLNKLILSSRSAMHSAKDIKDISHNIKEFEASGNDVKVALYRLLKGNVNDFYLTLHNFMLQDLKATRFERLIELKELNRKNYNRFLNETFTRVRDGFINELEVSTLLNVNREVYNSNKSLLKAIKEIALPVHESADFDKVN